MAAAPSVPPPSSSSPSGWDNSARDRAQKLLAHGDVDDLAAMAGHCIWARWRGANSGSTLLHFAPSCVSGKDPPRAHVVVPFLVAQGLHVDVRDGRGRTALQMCYNAPRAHRAAWFLALVDAGADLHATDNAGRTSLYYALRTGETANVERLVAAGVRPSDADRTHLVEVNNKAVLEVFWAAYGPPSTESERTALLLEACARGHWQVAETLLEYGVDLSATRGGLTALTMACQRTRPPAAFVERLVSMGMDPAQVVVDQSSGKSLTALSLLEQTEKTLSASPARRKRRLTAVRTAIASGRQQRLETVLEETAAPTRSRSRM